MAETQYSIYEWQTQTFGIAPNCLRTVTRANEEMAELLVDMSLGNSNKIAGEIADIFIVLYGLASAMQIDVTEAIDTKMTVNRARRWTITDSGHGYHVKD